LRDNVEDDKIVFAKRNTNTFENRFIGSYIFTSRMAMDIRIRHYWSNYQANEFYELLDDGTLIDYSYEPGYASNSTNFFNVDFTYRWQFSPGSELTFFWQNAISSFNENTDVTFFQNFENVFEQPGNNNISLKVIYFLDYLYLKKLGKGRKLKS